jgi:hypothetical protein
VLLLLLLLVLRTVTAPVNVTVGLKKSVVDRLSRPLTMFLYRASADTGCPAGLKDGVARQVQVKLRPALTTKRGQLALVLLGLLPWGC